MSNDREDRVDDARVAETYRTLAQERAPDRLDRKVLRMAAREGRTPYSRARAWMRPAAWAATIALSLAIVLELTRLPQLEPELADIATPAQESREATGRDAVSPAPPAEQADPVSVDAFTPGDLNVLREAENRAQTQAGPERSPETPRADAGAVSTGDMPAGKLEVDPDRGRQEAVDRAVGKRVSAAVPSLAVAASEQAPEPEPACPAKLRDSAESWFACIERLRESGQQELADREYEEFRRIFPDFVASDADR